MTPAPAHVLQTSLTAAIERALGHAGVDPLLGASRQPGVDLQANFAFRARPTRDVGDGAPSMTRGSGCRWLPSRRPSSSTTRRRTSPRRCTSGTCGPP